MQLLERIVERIYGETDFARSFATSAGGIVGLVLYLLSDDPVIAAFSAIIAFPVARLGASAVYRRVSAKASRHEQEAEADRQFAKLTEAERIVVSTFVASESCVLTWGEMNRSSASSSGVESLSQRGLVNTSMTLDGMRETFVLDTAIFDAGVRASRRPAI